MEDIIKLEHEAAACQPGDTCVFANASECTCGDAVNASQLAHVNDEVAHVACGSTEVLCRAEVNPRCENGLCVSDPE